MKSSSYSLVYVKELVFCFNFGCHLIFEATTGVLFSI